MADISPRQHLGPFPGQQNLQHQTSMVAFPTHKKWHFRPVIRTVEKTDEDGMEEFIQEKNLGIWQKLCKFGKGGLIPSNKYVTWLSPEKKKEPWRSWHFCRSANPHQY